MYKVGLFDAGHKEKIDLNHWQEVADVSIAGFFDPDDKAATEIENTFAIKRFRSEDELIDACDLIHVATPAAFHFAVCEKAIRKGKHVFVEKPMARSMNEADQLVKLVKESSVKFQVGHVERFNPAFLAINGLDLRPMLIEGHRLIPISPRSTEVNIILDLMIYDIDIVLSIVKSEVKTISACGMAVMADTPDIANVRIEFNNGCVANLTSSRISLKELSTMRLFQKDFYTDLDFLNKKTKIIRLKTDENLFSIDTPHVPEENAIKQEFQEFVACIKNNTRPVVNEIDGFRAMEVAHLILKKINSNFSTAY
jgi:predicted dehydrogenase